MSKTLCGDPEMTGKIMWWSALVEVLHIASLVHDDVIDNSPIRRGRETVHKRFGKRTAVFVGNYIVGKAYCAQYSGPKESTTWAITESTPCIPR